MKRNYKFLNGVINAPFKQRQIFSNLSGMRQVFLIAMVIFASVSDSAAQALITAAQGGFENGTSTFAANGWIEKQTTSTRKLFVGTAAGSKSGTKAAYAGSSTSNNGVTNASINHFYRDVAIPVLTGGQQANLSFWVKMPTVDPDWDFLDVMYTTTANTPVAGTFVQYNGIFSNTATAYSAWTKVGPVNLSALSGTTVRIVVTFETDGGAPHANPALDDFDLTVSVPLPPTQCATLNSPANAATNVTNFTLAWTPPSSGPAASSYDVYIGTTASPAFFANVTANSVVVTGYAPNTTYYWKVIPKSATGSDATGCEVRSFTTGNPFLPYCNTIAYSSGIEPITLVNFAGINRTSLATVGGTPALENYIADVANVTTANSYNITLKGNTDGTTFTNNFVVFFDWNHDGDMNDANEIYPAGSIMGSTGVDGIQAVTAIAIPEGALAGPTRMRVKKLYSADSGVITNPCTGGQYGQSEDYTVNVTACTPTFTWYADADGDTFGNPAVTLVRCVQPVGYVANSTDCNDGDAAIHQTFQFYVDADGDAYGTGNLVSVCAVNATTPPANYSLNNTDCNDGDNTKHDSFPFYVDADGDSFGTGSLVSVCAVNGATPPAGYSLNNTDCDDTNIGIYQTATFFVDADNDGYTNGTASVCYGATTPVGYKTTSLGDDCNDNDNTVYQSATLFVDADNDGYDNGTQVVCYGAAIPAGFNASTLGSDCNDADNTIYQSATLFVDADNDGYDGGTAVVCYGATIPEGFKATTLGTDCNDALAAINAGATEIPFNGIDENCNGLTDENGQLVTSLLSANCNTTLASIGSLVGITTVAGYPTITGYRVRATNGAEVQTIERGVPNFTMQMFASFSYATTYTIDIELERNGIWMGYYGPTCQISTPAILAEGGAAAISPLQCGITLPKINTLVATTSIQGVTGYRFRVTNMTDVVGPNQVQIVTRTLNWFTLQMLTRSNYGTRYQIEVAVKTTGGFGGYGSPCEISSPPAPSLINCEATIATNTSLIACTSLAGVTQYRFQVTRDSDGASTTIDRSSNYFTYSNVPLAIQTPGAFYNVRVAVMTSGIWSPFGDICQITSPGAPAAKAGSAVAETMVDFKAVASPNPFNADFGIEITTTSQDNVSVKVYDMLGRMVESTEVKVSDLSTTKVGAQYPAGVYNVIVSQSGIVKTLRVIKR